MISQAEAETGGWLDRGVAAKAAAEQLEETNRISEALTRYRQAFEFGRKVHPFYRREDTKYYGADPEDGDLAQLAQSAIARLDPQSSQPPRATLRVHIAGTAIPDEIESAVEIVLVDVSVSPKRNEEIDDKLSGKSITLQGNQPQVVGVFNGRYRMFGRGHGGGWPSKPEFSKIGSLLTIDLSALEREIDVKDGMIDVTIPSYLKKEVVLLAPAADAKIDVQSEVFQWQSVPGAAYYKVHFTHRIKGPQGGTGYYDSGVYKTTQTSICLATAQADDGSRNETLKGLTPGREGGWTVSAYGKNDEEIAKTVGGSREFLVVRGLADDTPPPKP